jgi:hypothetical protein
MLTEHQIASLLQAAALGIGGLLAVLWINSFFIRRVSLRYEVRARRHAARRSYNRVFFGFFVSVAVLAVVQLGAIAVWAVLLRVFGVVDEPIRALLFAGSCYTTLGIVTDIAGERWTLLPIFIAISGIFSFALSTASVLNMTPTFRRAWYGKHADHVRAMLEAEGIELSETDLAEMLADPLRERRQEGGGARLGATGRER